MDFSPLPRVPNPIYHSQGRDATLYYAPGYLLRVEKDLVPLVDGQILSGRHDCADASVSTLLNHASRAKDEWVSLLERPYQPHSLHLYLNRRCQLACHYCFSNLSDVTDFAEISFNSTCAAANLVAKNCAEKDIPLTVVFHGGGEPVLSWRLIDALQPELQKIADKHGIALFRYIATNGVMTEQRAWWLASSFDLVGLSIDGPPDIQSAQRPYRNSDKDNLSTIIRTGHILREASVPIHVRVTVTAESALRQAEICRYLCENVSPRVISVEPVYRGGRADTSMQIRDEQQNDFVKSFFEARAEAHRHGSEWQISGARLDEVHGPYCNIFRQVLQLAPGDTMSACFKDVSMAQAYKRDMIIGRFDGDVQLDDRQICSLRATFTRPKACETCFLGYHCTYNCPNTCLLENVSTTDILCKLLKGIFSLRLIELGDKLSHAGGKITGMIVASG